MHKDKHKFLTLYREASPVGVASLTLTLSLLLMSDLFSVDDATVPAVKLNLLVLLVIAFTACTYSAESIRTQVRRNVRHVRIFGLLITSACLG